VESVETFLRLALNDLLLRIVSGFTGGEEVFVLFAERDLDTLRPLERDLGLPLLA